MKRFLVIMADDAAPDTLFTDERELRVETMDTANVLATDAYEAIAMVFGVKIENDPRPLAALTSTDLRAMADALERCPLTEHRRIMYTLGGYATTKELAHAAAADEGTSHVLKV